MRYLLVFPIGLVALVLLLVLARLSSATGPGAPTFFSVDSTSPAVPGVSAGDILEAVKSGGPPSPKYVLEISAGNLGLAGGHNIDALSGGDDWVDPIEPCPIYVSTKPGPTPTPSGPAPTVKNWASTNYFWSVDRASTGAGTGGFVIATWNGGKFGFVGKCVSGGGPVPPELAGPTADGAAGDIFVQFWKADDQFKKPQPPAQATQNDGALKRINVKWDDESDLGLSGLPAPIDELDALQSAFGTGTVDFDSTGNNAPDASDVFFSVDPPTAAALAVSPADILVVPAGGAPPPAVYATEAALGLQAGDDIDALCVADGDTDFSNGGLVLISLARGSPSLGVLYSAADAFRISSPLPFPGGGIQVPFLPHYFLSLLPTDNLDGLFCSLGDPGTELKIDPTGGGDTDGDGCADHRELGPDQTTGGLRDPQNEWDFYDVGSGAGIGIKDGFIDLFNDIVQTITAFGTYNVAADRSAGPGPYPWNIAGPDGTVDLFNDIVGVIQQFGHNCN